MGTNITPDGEVAIERVLTAVPQEKLVDSIVGTVATNRVVSDPLPGPMLNAVANQELEIITSRGKVILRPVVIYDFTIFKKINSPHYRTMLEAANKDIEETDLKIEDEELYEMIFQFTHSCKEIRAILKKGREYFREVATESIADRYSMPDLEILLNGLAKQIQSGFATMVAHDVETKENDSEISEEVSKKKLM
jgi:predicted DNA-binding protein (UPF0278 family)